MQTFRAADGTMLAFRDAGAGLPLLALAGLTRDSRDFDYLAPHLPPGIRLIRLDSRGRGASARAAPESYTVAQEAADVLALLDHLGLGRVAILGSSRGGLIGLALAAMARPRLSGLCLNDVGPVVEPAGLRRIAAYLGVAPRQTTLAAVAEALPRSLPGFDGVPASRWQEEAERHFVQHEGHVGLPYDPALRIGFEAAMAAAPPDLWPLFDACAGLPLALVRGAASDLISAGTVAEMRRRRPDMGFADIAGRAHIPFLDEPPAVALIGNWLGQVRAAEAARGAMSSGSGAAG
jgi:pimeloyl-ACP methyl ester carboxylesterase